MHVIRENKRSGGEKRGWKKGREREKREREDERGGESLEGGDDGRGDSEGGVGYRMRMGGSEYSDEVREDGRIKTTVESSLKNDALHDLKGCSLPDVRGSLRGGEEYFAMQDAMKSRILFSDEDEEDGAIIDGKNHAGNDRDYNRNYNRKNNNSFLSNRSNNSFLGNKSHNYHKGVTHSNAQSNQHRTPLQQSNNNPLQKNNHFRSHITPHNSPTKRSSEFFNAVWKLLWLCNTCYRSVFCYLCGCCLCCFLLFWDIFRREVCYCVELHYRMRLDCVLCGKNLSIFEFF